MPTPSIGQVGRPPQTGCHFRSLWLANTGDSVHNNIGKEECHLDNNVQVLEFDDIWLAFCVGTIRFGRGDPFVQCATRFQFSRFFFFCFSSMCFGLFPLCTRWLWVYRYTASSPSQLLSSIFLRTPQFPIHPLHSWYFFWGFYIVFIYFSQLETICSAADSTFPKNWRVARFLNPLLLYL